MVLLLGQAYSVADALIRNDLGDTRMTGMLFGLASIIVVGFWGRWWYAQRVHFGPANEVSRV